MGTPDYAKELTSCLHFNSVYCEKHGYTHLATLPPLPGIHAGFQKPYVLLRNIHRFDYVMWVDVDASFINHDKKIEDIIDTNSDREVWYCGDPACWHLNSGVLIFKNSINAINLLWEWWGSCPNDPNYEWVRGQDGDQIRLERLLFPGWVPSDGTPCDSFGEFALDPSIMNTYPKNLKAGDFLIHFMGYRMVDIRQHMTFLVKNKLSDNQYVGKYLETLGGMLPDALDREKSGDSREIKTEDVQKRMLL